MYNMTAIMGSNATISNIITVVNTSTNNMFMGLTVFAIYIILLISFRKSEVTTNLMTSSLIAFVISAVLSSGGFLNFKITIAFLTILGLTGLYVFMKRNN